MGACAANSENLPRCHHHREEEERAVKSATEACLHLVSLFFCICLSLFLSLPRCHHRTQEDEEEEETGEEKGQNLVWHFKRRWRFLTKWDLYTVSTRCVQDQDFFLIFSDCERPTRPSSFLSLSLSALSPLTSPQPPLSVSIEIIVTEKIDSLRIAGRASQLDGGFLLSLVQLREREKEREKEREREREREKGGGGGGGKRESSVSGKFNSARFAGRTSRVDREKKEDFCSSLAPHLSFCARARKLLKRKRWGLDEGRGCGGREEEGEEGRKGGRYAQTNGNNYLT